MALRHNLLLLGPYEALPGLANRLRLMRFRSEMTTGWTLAQSYRPNLRLIQQPQIRNPDFAFAYPSFYTNQCGDVGTAVMFGGGSFQPSSAVTVLTPAGVLTSTVYYPELSNGCEDRNGDYLTVRSANGVDFQGYIYDKQSDARGALHGHSRIMGFSRG
jgi:hypothetical protein